MIVLVFGGRDFEDYPRLAAVLNRVWQKHPSAELLSGGARGADTLAIEWAALHGIKTHVEMADWTRLKKAAGPVRNQLMLDRYKPRGAVMFPGWRGTPDMLSRCLANGVPVLPG